MVSPLKQRFHRLKSQITQIIILFTVHCSLFTFGYAQSSQHIRVAIIQDAPSLRLQIKGIYKIIDLVENKILYQSRNLNTTVTAYGAEISLGKVKFKADKLLIKSDYYATTIIDGRIFRGNIQLIKKDNSHLLVINQIGLEDYVKGILYHEASHYWPMEALKAQAIVCRTYAICQIQENKLKDFDVTSDIYSQVYGGKTSERYRTNEAVNQTKGIILTYMDRVFFTYYHATCAGYTEDASRIWNIDIPPLKGVVCIFCKESPHFSWHYVMPLRVIKDKLVNAGYKINNIKNIKILGKDKSGRITELEIIAENKNVKISSKEFRNIIGLNIIRSTNFEINILDNDAVFVGFGWGHGVGLCQWGAYFMAKQGKNYKEILKYYYPETKVGTFNF